ncbi:hypothetical protein [Streptomyces sp. NPDC047315]|uniref:DUF7736 domain-containing protein n=1 Tax=Streptomyces sp. NPDC047315 TaxID=3155142 RepID=UPI0033E69DA2
MESRAFPLADILSVTTPTLLSRRGMDGLTDLLSWMTGEPLQRHQLLRAGDECAPALLQQHPQLVGIVPPPGLDRADLYAWLVEQERIHGAELTVTPLTEWTRQHPVQELVDRIDLARLPVVDG